jgi:hypothetical protein
MQKHSLQRTSSDHRAQRDFNTWRLQNGRLSIWVDFESNSNFNQERNEECPWRAMGRRMFCQ